MAHGGRGIARWQCFINKDRLGQLVKMPLAPGEGIALLIPQNPTELVVAQRAIGKILLDRKSVV